VIPAEAVATPVADNLDFAAENELADGAEVPQPGEAGQLRCLQHGPHARTIPLDND